MFNWQKDKAGRGGIKGELVVLAVLIPLVVILGAIIVRWPRLVGGEEELVGRGEIEESDQLEVAPAEMAASPSSEVVQTDVSVEHAVEKVALVVDHGEGQGNWFVKVTDGVTVEQVLRSAEEEDYLDVELVDYGDPLGVLVKSLDGVVNDESAQRYWFLYINGELSPVGASQAKVKGGDVVTWKYERQRDEY